MKSTFSRAMLAAMIFIPIGCADDLTPIAAGCAAEETANYIVEFKSLWKSDTHIVYPSNAHFSPVVGATHAPEVSLWGAERFASEGVKLMAETGKTEIILSEIATKNGTEILANTGLSDFSSVVEIPFDIVAGELVSLVTMIAPSPDWFLGVDSLGLQTEDDCWLSDLSVDLVAWDAGTDDGNTYAAANTASSPAQAIALVDLEDISIFNGKPAFGSFKFIRQ